MWRITASPLVNAHAERAAALPALLPARLRAKAELARPLHGADLALAAERIEQRALASLCDDLTGGGMLTWVGRPRPCQRKRRHLAAPPSLGKKQTELSEDFVSTQAKSH